MTLLAPSVRAMSIGLVLVVGTFALSRIAAFAIDFEHVLAIGLALAVFMVTFVKMEIGLYLLVLSMLLSPEYSLGPEMLAEARAVVLRSEDVLLLVIGLSWLAKTAVNKEGGLVLLTPLNRPILAYLASAFGATLVGYLSGTVHTAAGFLYVLKYTEYFAVYYIVVNNLSDRQQARRLIILSFITAAIVSLVAVGLTPGGERVSAPFEGKSEPNTLGGYLLFTLAILGGLAAESDRPRVRLACAGLLVLILPAFALTLSRASYLGLVPALAVLLAQSKRRMLIGGLLVTATIMLVAEAVILNTPLRSSIVERVVTTFQPELDQPSVIVGSIAFDPSTSQRFLSMRAALEAWMASPILGYGVTGFRFLDSQYARTLVETGAVGLAAFLWLVWALARNGLAAVRTARDPEERGFAVGFLAGTAGLLAHAVAANTFIIVRIMEPFWLFAAIVMRLPRLEEASPPALDPISDARRA